MAKAQTYLFHRIAAICLGVALTAYSCWANWSHTHDLLGPLAGLSAASLLTFAEVAVGRGQRLWALSLGFSGLLAAAISGSIVMERVTSQQETRLHGTRSNNLPRIEAQKALDEVKVELAKSASEATQECRSGRKAKCLGLEAREEAARQRVVEKRAELAKLGAHEVGVQTIASSYLPFLLPLWLEIASPLTLAWGLSVACKLQAPKTKQEKPKSKRPNRYLTKKRAMAKVAKLRLAA